MHDFGPPDHLHEPQDASADLQARPSLEGMLEAIPVNVEIAVDLDHLADLPDPDDPARDDNGRRFCIAARRAGGRCTAPPSLNSLLCTAHSGLLDASAGGKAKAQKHRAAQLDAEEVARLARLGARGVIAATANENPVLLRRAFLVLLEDAAAGDRQAAKLVGPWLNQGLGMPTETVVTERPETLADVEAASTAQLEDMVAARRAARQAAAAAADPETATG